MNNYGVIIYENSLTNFGDDFARGTRLESKIQLQ